MAYVEFKCPHCQQSLEVDESCIGQRIDCPACGGAINLAESLDDARATRDGAEAGLSPGTKSSSPKRPSEGQIAYADAIGVEITPAMTRDDVSNAITAALKALSPEARKQLREDNAKIRKEEASVALELQARARKWNQKIDRNTRGDVIPLHVLIWREGDIAEARLAILGGTDIDYKSRTVSVTFQMATIPTDAGSLGLDWNTHASVLEDRILVCKRVRNADAILIEVGDAKNALARALNTFLESLKTKRVVG